MDWGSARNSRDGLPPQRERSNRTPRKQEPEFDWNTARNTQAELPVRERERPQRENPDGTPRENSTRQTPRKQEPEFDWGAARNTKTSLPPRERLNRTGSNSGKNQLNLISIGKEAKVYHHVMFQDQVVTEKMLKR